MAEDSPFHPQTTPQVRMQHFPNYQTQTSASFQHKVPNYQNYPFNPQVPNFQRAYSNFSQNRFQTPPSLYTLNQNRGNFWPTEQSCSYQNPPLQPVSCSYQPVSTSCQPVYSNSIPRRQELFANLQAQNNPYSQSFSQNPPFSFPGHAAQVSSFGFPPPMFNSKNNNPELVAPNPNLPELVPSQSQSTSLGSSGHRSNLQPGQPSCPQRAGNKGLVPRSEQASRKQRKRKLLYQSARHTTLSTPETPETVVTPNSSGFKPYDFAFPPLDTSVGADKTPKVESFTFEEFLAAPLNPSIVSVSSLLKTSEEEDIKTEKELSSSPTGNQTIPDFLGNLVIEEKIPQITIPDFNSCPVLVPDRISLSTSSDIYSPGSGRLTAPLSPISVGSPVLDVVSLSPVAGPSRVIKPSFTSSKQKNIQNQKLSNPTPIPTQPEPVKISNPSFRWCPLPVSTPIRRGPKSKYPISSQSSGAKTRAEEHFQHECLSLGCTGTDSRYLPQHRFPGNFLESREQIEPPNLAHCFKRFKNSVEPWDKDPFYLNLRVGCPEHFKYKSINLTQKSWFFTCQQNHTGSECRCNFAKQRILAWIDLDLSVSKQGKKTWGKVNVSEHKKTRSKK